MTDRIGQAGATYAQTADRLCSEVAMRSLVPFLVVPLFFLPTHRKEAAAARVSISGTEDARGS